MKTGLVAILFAVAAPFAIAFPVNTTATLVVRDTLNTTVVLDTKREAGPSSKARAFSFKPRDLHVEVERSFANGVNPRTNTTLY